MYPQSGGSTQHDNLTCFRSRWSLRAWIVLVITVFAVGCGKSRTVEEAIKDLNSEKAKVREDAAISLEILARDSNESTKKKIVAALQKALIDPSEDVRSEAANTLGSIGSAAREAVPQLAQCLRDPVERVRNNAAASICQIAEGDTTKPVPKSKEVIAELLDALRDEAPGVRSWATRGLVALAPKDRWVLGAVAYMLDDPDPTVRDRARRALESVGWKGKP